MNSLRLSIAAIARIMDVGCHIEVGVLNIDYCSHTVNIIMSGNYTCCTSNDIIYILGRLLYYSSSDLLYPMM